MIATLLLACALAASQSPTAKAQAPTGAWDKGAWEASNPGGGGAFAAVGAGTSGILVAASDLSGAYVSHDRGQSWFVLGPAQGLDNTHVGGLGFHRERGEVFFLGSEVGIFRSRDAGGSVQQVWSGGYVEDVACSPVEPGLAFAAAHSAWNASDGFVLRSRDHGSTWERAGALPKGLRLLEVLPAEDSAQVVYALAGKGRFAQGPEQLLRSSDQGTSWSVAAESLGPRVLDASVHPARPQSVYLTLQDEDPKGPGQLWRSDDHGQSWQAQAKRGGVLWPGAGPDELRLVDVRYAYPWDERQGVWSSTDGGMSFARSSSVADWEAGWSQVHFRFGESYSGAAHTLGMDLSDPNQAWWVNKQFVFSLAEGGARVGPAFTQQQPGGGWRSNGFDNVVPVKLAVSQADPRYVYAGYLDIGLWRSEDGGQSWRNANLPAATGGWEGSGGNSWAIATDPTRPERLWASMAADQQGPASLHASWDAGRSWAPCSGLPAAPMAGLSVDPSSPEDARTLYVTCGGDLYRSGDDGEVWSRVFEQGGLRSTAVLGAGEVVFAGGEAGLWRSQNHGEAGSWSRVGKASWTGQVSGLHSWFWAGVSDLHAVSPGELLVTVRGPGGGLFRSRDQGQSFERLLEGDHLYAAVTSPGDEDSLWVSSSSAFESGGYRANSRGILRSIDGGKSFVPQNAGLAWPMALSLAAAPGGRLFVASPGAGVLRWNPAPHNPFTAPLRQLSGGHAFTEGPVSDGAGGVYFTDQPKNQVLHWSPEQGTRVVLEPAGRANGLSIAPDGKLLACADDRGELWSIDPGAGTHKVLSSGYGGQRFNGPNDLWRSPSGSLYFTDPFYARPYWNHDQPTQDRPRVYRLDPDGQLHPVAEDFTRPNGILGTPDGQRLFVADTGADQTWSFDIQPDGSLENRQLLVQQGSDGLTLTPSGLLVLTGEGLTLVDPASGEVLARRMTPGRTSNVTMGGQAGTTLFVTCSQRLFSLNLR